ncbi:hypothetical protein SDC9_125269 [bioreactor metagenome]|uniref:Uncharacterized protein n=1 Tax=bioreactor metagenome TaxID=1076179 RepID=A0A645CMX3_9ZZZZ
MGENNCYRIPCNTFDCQRCPGDGKRQQYSLRNLWPSGCSCMDGGASDRGPGLQYTDGNKRRFGSLPFLQLRQAGPGEDEEGDKVRAYNKLGDHRRFGTYSMSVPLSVHRAFQAYGGDSKDSCSGYKDNHSRLSNGNIQCHVQRALCCDGIFILRSYYPDLPLPADQGSCCPIFVRYLVA